METKCSGKNQTFYVWQDMVSTSEEADIPKCQRAETKYEVGDFIEEREDKVTHAFQRIVSISAHRQTGKS